MPVGGWGFPLAEGAKGFAEFFERGGFFDEGIEVVVLRQFFEVAGYGNDGSLLVGVFGAADHAGDVGAIELRQFDFHHDDVELDFTGSEPHGFGSVDDGDGATAEFLQ